MLFVKKKKKKDLSYYTPYSYYKHYETHRLRKNLAKPEYDRGPNEGDSRHQMHQIFSLTVGLNKNHAD